MDNSHRNPSDKSLLLRNRLWTPWANQGKCCLPGILVHCMQVRSRPLYLQLQFAHKALQFGILPCRPSLYVTRAEDLSLLGLTVPFSPGSLFMILKPCMTTCFAGISQAQIEDWRLYHHSYPSISPWDAWGASQFLHGCARCVPASPFSTAPALYQCGMSLRGVWMTYNQKKACRSSVETEWLLKINLLIADATHYRPISAKDIIAEVTFHLENPKALL